MSDVAKCYKKKQLHVMNSYFKNKYSILQVRDHYKCIQTD